MKARLNRDWKSEYVNTFCLSLPWKACVLKAVLNENKT